MNALFRSSSIEISDFWEMFELIFKHSMNKNFTSVFCPITHPHIELQITENLDGSLGGYFWPSARILAMYLLHNSHLFLGKAVLELGAGLGVPGLLLGLLGAKSVLLTDNSKSIILNLTHNIAANNCINCSAEILSWEVELTDDIHADLIIGADLFYEPADFEALLCKVASILAFNSDKACKFITTYQERSSKRNIQHLLDRFNLAGKIIPIYYEEHEIRGFFSSSKKTVLDISVFSVYIIEIYIP